MAIKRLTAINTIMAMRETRPRYSLQSCRGGKDFRFYRYRKQPNAFRGTSAGTRWTVRY